MDHIMEVCHKGIFSWFSNDVGNKGLLSFDLHAEEFRTIPLPDCKHLLAGRTLKVWTDSIAFVACCGYYGTTISIKMWVMKYCSDGVSDSSFIWIKYLSNENCNLLRESSKNLEPIDILEEG